MINTKQFFSFLFLILSASLFLACGSEETSSSAEKAEDEQWKTSEQMKENEQSMSSDAQSDALTLNNGQKWMVNEEMKPHILESEKMLQDFQKKEKTNYDMLANSLQKKNVELIQSCTMKGESHDELHKWLEPHMSLIKELAAADNEVEARMKIDELQASFEKYHKYFQ